MGADDLMEHARLARDHAALMERARFHVKYRVLLKCERCGGRQLQLLGLTCPCSGRMTLAPYTWSRTDFAPPIVMPNGQQIVLIPRETAPLDSAV